MWWILTASGAVQPILLPNIPSTFLALGNLVTHPELILNAVGTTSGTVVIAFVIAGVVGVVIGLVVGSRPLLSRAYEPLLANLSAVPIILLYPLLLGAMGSGPAAKILVGVIVAALPIAIATQSAERSVDQDLVTASRSMGASRRAVIGSVVLPSIFPHIFTGLRTGLGLTIVTVVAGEFLSSTSGIGYELAQTSEAFHTADLFAWLVVTLIFTAVFIGVLSAIEALVERKVST